MKDSTLDNPNRGLLFAPFFSIGAPVCRPRIVGSIMAETMPVDVVTSDFDHAEKVRRKHLTDAPFQNIIYLPTRPYFNNTGCARLLSHLLFSFRAAQYFKENRDKYDVVYCTAPLNVMTWLIFRLATGKTKIVDVVDIWPDVLPFPPIARKLLAPFFALWKWFFNSAVAKADIVMAVSDEFIEESKKYASKTAKVKRFYIGHERLSATTEKESLFTIAYVGNLGRLYDFETLLDVMAEDDLRECVQLFVVGCGNRQDWLIEELESRKLHYRYFGPVFEHDRLGKILNRCHVGFNGYVNTTAAFSYKANTYLAAGLPILNSMTGDLMRLVSEFGFGLNYDSGNRMQLRDCLLSLLQNGSAEMAECSKRFFDSHLDSSRIGDDMSKFIAASLKSAGDSFIAEIEYTGVER